MSDNHQEKRSVRAQGPAVCHMTKNRTTRCFRLCIPDDGYGRCGRQAAHAMKSKLQLAIERHKARKQG